MTDSPESPSPPRIAVVDYGIGNLRSAEKAMQRLGADARRVTDAADIDRAAAVVLPGVGAFGACMDALDASGLRDAVVRAASSGRPFLGICVGMQLLFEGSEESPGRSGLGVFGGTIQELPGDVKRPQMQWNPLELSPAGRDHPVLAPADGHWMYFVHSFAAPLDTTATVLATCDYGGPVVAAVGNASVCAVQFHPEKSGSFGLALLTRFVDSVETPGRPATTGARP